MKKIILIIIVLCLSCNSSKIKNQKKSNIYTNPFAQKITSDPNYKGQIILELPEGAEVKVTASLNGRANYNGQLGRWIEVEYKNQTGWIFGLNYEISEKNALYLKNFNNFTKGCLGDYGSGQDDSTAFNFWFNEDHTAESISEGESWNDLKWKVENNILIVEGFYSDNQSSCWKCDVSNKSQRNECIKNCRKDLFNKYGKIDNLEAKVKYKFYILENGMIKSEVSGVDPNPVVGKQAWEIPKDHWHNNFIWGQMYKYR